MADEDEAFVGREGRINGLGVVRQPEAGLVDGHVRRNGGVASSLELSHDLRPAPTVVPGAMDQAEGDHLATYPL